VISSLSDVLVTILTVMVIELQNIEHGNMIWYKHQANVNICIVLRNNDLGWGVSSYMWVNTVSTSLRGVTQ
jgi:hypothetical protein